MQKIWIYSDYARRMEQLEKVYKKNVDEDFYEKIGELKAMKVIEFSFRDNMLFWKYKKTYEISVEKMFLYMLHSYSMDDRYEWKNDNEEADEKFEKQVHLW